MNSLRRSIPPIGCLLLLLVVVSLARAEWPANGLRLSSLPENRYPVMTSDGQGGAFFALADGSQYSSMDWDLRIFRISAGGTRPLGWPDSGIPVSQTVWADWPNAGAVNADGSFTLSFVVHDLNALAHAARYTAEGAVLPGSWAGLPLLASTGFSQAVTEVLSMPDGGNLFTFLQGSSDPDIWMQRLGSDGQAAAGWPTTGRPFVGGPGWQNDGQRPMLISDGAGGAWTAYVSDQIDPEANVYLARIDASGDAAVGWPTYGFSITSAPGVQSQPAIATDGGSGVYVAWVDARSYAGQPWNQSESGWDIYLQHVNADGATAAGWPALGLPVCVWPTIQEAPLVAPDSAGGVFVAWQYSGPQGYMVHAQHILADGSIAPGWPEGGKRMFDVEGYADLTEMVSDQLGGFFISCEIQTPGGRWKVRVQHVNAAGQFDSPWGAAGFLVSTATSGYNNQRNPHLISSFPGSAIVCWDDGRNFYYNTYVQRITVNGIVATELSLASHDAQPDRVTLEWVGADAMLASASLERRELAAEWRQLAELTIDGEGRLRYEDRDVTPGTAYEYRLRYTSDGQIRTTAIATITVPVATPFALKGATPNPSPRQRLTIAYSLAERGPARLELFDAQGRCVALRDVGALGLGAHTVTLDEARSLHAGLYWTRLTQGARQVTARVVLVD